MLPFITTNEEAFFRADISLITREGIELEKGVQIDEDFLIKHEKLFRKYYDFFTAYPDLSKAANLLNG